MCNPEWEVDNFLRIYLGKPLERIVRVKCSIDPYNLNLQDLLELFGGKLPLWKRLSCKEIFGRGNSADLT